MKVEIGAEAALFPEKEYIKGIFVAVWEVHFGGFFHQMKVRQPIARQDSMQTLIRTRRRLKSFLHEAAQNFELFKYSRSKIKN